MTSLTAKSRNWLCLLFVLCLFGGVPLPGALAQTTGPIELDTSFYQGPADQAPLPLRSGFFRPKNIILLIGDGMGLGQLDVTRNHVVGSANRLHMQRMPVSGFVSTYSSSSLVTDSAAAATALAAGYKTNNGAIAVGPDGTQFRTILEAARDRGMLTGVVATYSPTHATPASFLAHVSSRGLESDIAIQILATAPDVVFGGGKAYFIPQSVEGSLRKDNLDLIAQARKQGYAFLETREALLGVSSRPGGKLLGLFAPVGMTTRDPEPSLAEMTGVAIDRLAKSRKGYFLMVEGSQIDSFSHLNAPAETVRQTLLFDQAVAVALEKAQASRDTLVVVTADHITGGMNIVAGHPDGSHIEIKWVHGSHLGGQVPLFAFGPGAQRFAGFRDNTELPRIMADLLRIRDFPKQIGLQAEGKYTFARSFPG